MMNFKQIIFNNFGLKLTALVLAIFVWIMISGKERAYSEKNLEVNVEYINMAKNIDVRNVSPEKVRVKVKGTSKELNRISPEDFELKIDLRGTIIATKLNRFVKDYLKYPESISVVSVYPQWIEISVEEFFSKEVPVRILYTGRLSRGVRLVERKVIPEKVGIFGYKSQISKINEVTGADTINLAEINASKTVVIPLKKIEEILRFEGSDQVRVSLVVENEREKKK